MSTQQDFITGLVEIRQICDQYSKLLTTYDEADTTNLDQDELDSESEAPAVFSYSLYYVYYD